MVIVIEYGAIVMEVAKAVKANVARAVNHMLGLRVVEVDVTVDRVAMPRRAKAGALPADRPRQSRCLTSVRDSRKPLPSAAALRGHVTVSGACAAAPPQSSAVATAATAVVAAQFASTNGPLVAL